MHYTENDPGARRRLAHSRARRDHYMIVNLLDESVPGPTMVFTSGTGREEALRRWATTQDRERAMRPANEGRMRKYYDLVDPDRKLDPAERERRAVQLRRADMMKMTREREARRKRKVAAAG